MSIRNKPVYRILLWGTFFASLWLLARMAPTLVDPKYLPADDFSHFWEAGQLNNQGQNPYDPEQQLIFNPPWTLPAVMLFALFDYPLARLAWLLVNIAIVIYCAEKLWQIYRGSPNRRWLAWLLVFTFSPTISTLHKGQFTPLVLLGMVGFLLTIEQRKRWFLAGVCAALITVKPQLFYLFWPALGLWILHKRAWPLILGAGLAFSGLLALPMLTNPSVIAQYIEGSAAFSLAAWATPTIGTYLRALINLEQFWLQFIPSVLVVAWLVYYWFQKRQSWRWKDELPLLVLVSMATMPYGWTYDQVILLPALILAAIWFSKMKDRRWGLVSLALYILLNVLNLWLHRYLDDFWFGWLAPGFLLCYLLIAWQRSKESKEAPVS